jgi:hypothetical protein
MERKVPNRSKETIEGTLQTLSNEDLDGAGIAGGQYEGIQYSTGKRVTPNGQTTFDQAFSNASKAAHHTPLTAGVLGEQGGALAPGGGTSSGTTG